MSDKTHYPSRMHATPSVVLTGRFAAASSARTTFDRREAAEALHGTGIAKFRDRPIFDSLPFVELSPQTPFVEGKGWLNFLNGWDVLARAEASPSVPSFGKAVWWPSKPGVGSGQFEVHLIGLPHDGTCVVALDVSGAGRSTPAGAGYKVSHVNTREAPGFHPAVPGFQTLLIPAVATGDTVWLQVELVNGLDQCSFTLATVQLVS